MSLLPSSPPFIRIRPLPIYGHCVCSIIVHAYFTARAAKSLNASRRLASLKRISSPPPLFLSRAFCVYVICGERCCQLPAFPFRTKRKKGEGKKETIVRNRDSFVCISINYFNIDVICFSTFSSDKINWNISRFSVRSIEIILVSRCCINGDYRKILNIFLEIIQ